MQPRSWKHVLVGAALVALLVAALFGYVAGSAPASQRNPAQSFNADPGPSTITFGQNVAYKAFLQNTTNSNFKNVAFSQTVPSVVVNDGTSNTILYATLAYSSCETPPYSTPVNNVYSCPTITTLNAGSNPVPYTLVWQSPTLPIGDTCVVSAPASVCQLTTTGTWNIKEGLTNSGSNDTFATTVNSTLLTVPDFSKAGGYPIQKCTDVNSNPTLITNQSVGSGNPMATKACAPVLPTGDALNPGLASTITERDAVSSDHLTNGFTQLSIICIAAVAKTCPDDASTAFQFPADTPATFVFVFDNHAYTKKITKMYENNVLVPLDSSQGFPYCDPPVYDGPNQTTTFVCHALHNSPWRGG